VKSESPTFKESPQPVSDQWHDRCAVTLKGTGTTGTMGTNPIGRQAAGHGVEYGVASIDVSCRG